MTRAGVRGGWPWRDSCLSGGGAWGPCGLSICGACEQQRTQPPDTGKEVTTHNGGYSGEALRAHSRPPGPGALAGWRPAALYIALCRGYRTAGAELVSLANHTGRAVHRWVRIGGEARAEIDNEERVAQRARCEVDPEIRAGSEVMRLWWLRLGSDTPNTTKPNESQTQKTRRPV